MIQVEELIASRYKVKQLISQGNTAELWLAQDIILRRKVMARVVSESFLENEHFLARFAHEAQILAQLEHPHIIPIYDYGVHGERPFQIQRFIGNPTLGQLLNDKETVMSTIDLLRLAQQIASAIDYMHQNGVVHRRIIAANVVLDEQRQPYLVNFNLAIVKNQKSLADRPIDREYLVQAPEIQSGEDGSYLTDIYAFGYLLYQLLSGREPEYRYNKVVSSLRDSRPNLPMGVELVVHKLLDYEPSNRFSSAVEAMNQLYHAFYSGQSSIQGRVFISYATKDKAYVHQLAKELRRLNVDIWIDQDIAKGADWGDSIERALKETDIMLLILSEASSVSEYVTHEWSFFMGSGKPVYPFVVHASPPKEIHPRLNRVQHIFGTNDMFTDISRIIDVLAGGNPSRIYTEV